MRSTSALKLGAGRWAFVLLGGLEVSRIQHVQNLTPRLQTPRARVPRACKRLANTEVLKFCPRKSFANRRRPNVTEFHAFRHDANTTLATTSQILWCSKSATSKTSQVILACKNLQTPRRPCKSLAVMVLAGAESKYRGRTYCAGKNLANNKAPDFCSFEYCQKLRVLAKTPLPKTMKIPRCSNSRPGTSQLPYPTCVLAKISQIPWCPNSDACRKAPHTSRACRRTPQIPYYALSNIIGVLKVLSSWYLSAFHGLTNLVNVVAPEFHAAKSLQAPRFQKLRKHRGTRFPHLQYRGDGI